MVFRRFRLNCIVRVVCLALTTALLCFLIIRTTLYASMVAVSVLIAYQIFVVNIMDMPRQHGMPVGHKILIKIVIFPQFNQIIGIVVAAGKIGFKA